MRTRERIHCGDAEGAEEEIQKTLRPLRLCGDGCWSMRGYK